MVFIQRWKRILFHLLFFACSVVSDSFATLWIVACQAPLSMGFPRQDYWTGLPFPTPGDLPFSREGLLPDPGIKSASLALAGRFFASGLIPPVQFSSVAQSCPTLCDPMNCSTPGLPVHHQLPEFTQTHVHWVSDAIQPSHPLSSPSPPAPIPPSIRVFSNESTLGSLLAQVLEFQF